MATVELTVPNQNITLTAGTRGPTGATGATGPQGVSAGPAYRISATTTMADPGTGLVRFNNASYGSATQIAISALTNETGNPDISAELVSRLGSNSAVKGHFRLVNSSETQKFMTYDVTGVTDNGTWLLLAVTYRAGSGAVSTGVDYAMLATRTGDPGSGDMLASVYDPGSIEQNAFNADYHIAGVTNSPFSIVEQNKLAALPASARLTLSADLNLYVATTGSDSNSGAIGAPFATIQKAVDVAATYDLNGYNITINIADGDYSANGQVNLRTLVGHGECRIIGNTTTPANVTRNLTTSGLCCFRGDNVKGNYRIRGMTLSSSTGFASCIRALGDGLNIFIGDLVLGVANNSHLNFESGAQLFVAGNYTINGNSPRHFYSRYFGKMQIEAGATPTVTLSGTPAFSTGFAVAQQLGLIYFNNTSLTFSGSGTGVRYVADYNALVDSNGGGASYFPGDSAGTTSNGGVYR